MAVQLEGSATHVLNFNRHRQLLPAITARAPMAGNEPVYFAALQYVAVCERSVRRKFLRLAREDAMDGEILPKMSMEPTHIRQAHLRPRAPTVVHCRDTGDGAVLPMQNELTFDSTGKIEVALVGGPPGELLPLLGGRDGIHSRIMDVVRLHQATKPKMNLGTVLTTIVDLVVPRRVRRAHV